MNSGKVGRKLVEVFPTIPSTRDIPRPVSDGLGGKCIIWKFPDGLEIRTFRHTMGRIFAEARYEGEHAEAYATSHVAAVRALIRWAHEFYA